MPSIGMAKAEIAHAKTEDRHQPWRRGRAESRADDDPDRLREGDQSGADEADDGERRRGRGLNRHREERTGYNRAQSAGDERLQRTAQRVARERSSALREVMDPEQEQSRVHPPSLRRSVHQLPFVPNSLRGHLFRLRPTPRLRFARPESFALTLIRGLPPDASRAAKDPRRSAVSDKGPRSRMAGRTQRFDADPANRRFRRYLDVGARVDEGPLSTQSRPLNAAMC